jgi:hypothetical protein
MRITGAKWSGGELTLSTSDPEAVRFALGFEEGDYSLTKAKKRRSLDANAYFFVLADKISEVTGVPKSEIYRHAIKEIGGNCDVVCVLEKAADTLCNSWEQTGLGWQTERFPSKIPGCINVILYYGSSTYDTATMSRLIDNIVQDAKALGIETLPQEKLSAMMEAWDGRKVG